MNQDICYKTWLKDIGIMRAIFIYTYQMNQKTQYQICRLSLFSKILQ